MPATVNPTSRRPGFKPRSPLERFEERVDRSSNPSGCWPWIGRTATGGYGRLSYDDGRGSGAAKVLAHRFAYEWFIGPIPDGMQIDHTCFVRRCCNPLHLEAVTQQENLRRTRAAGRGRRPDPSLYKQRCLRGHELAGENVRISTTKTGKVRRHCRLCDAIHNANRGSRR